GVTLVNAATMQAPSWEPGAANPKLPENLPAALRAPVSSCLRKDPGQRWTVEELEAFLRRNAAARPVFQPPPSSTRSKTPRYLLTAGAVGLLAASAAMLLRFFQNGAPLEQPALKELSPKAAVPTPAASIVRPVPGPRTAVNQVLPDVPAKARNTIQG